MLRAPSHWCRQLNGTQIKTLSLVFNSDQVMAYCIIWLSVINFPPVLCSYSSVWSFSGLVVQFPPVCLTSASVLPFSLSLWDILYEKLVYHYYNRLITDIPFQNIRQFYRNYIDVLVSCAWFLCFDKSDYHLLNAKF